MKPRLATRATLMLATALAAPVEGRAAEDTCDAAAFRLMDAIEAHVAETGQSFRPGMETEAARDATALRQAAELRATPEGAATCALILAMPDSSLRAMARARSARSVE